LSVIRVGTSNSAIDVKIVKSHEKNGKKIWKINTKYVLLQAIIIILSQIKLIVAKRMNEMMKNAVRCRAVR